MLVEEDVNNFQGNSNNLWEAASEVGMKFYKKGDIVESGIADLDTYLLKKVTLNIKFCIINLWNIITTFILCSGWVVSRRFRAESIPTFWERGPCEIYKFANWFWNFTGLCWNSYSLMYIFIVDSLKVSALVTGEFYTRNHFPGFARPFVFNAELLLKFVGDFTYLLIEFKKKMRKMFKTWTVPFSGLPYNCNLTFIQGWA